MALNLETTYAGRVTPSSAAYPFGEPRNETSSGANDGTPLERQWLADVMGFLQRILDEGHITPSGTPDTALVSDYMTGLKASLSPRVEIHGLRFAWFSAAGLCTLLDGRCRTWNNGRRLTHNPTISILKDLTLEWSEGGTAGTPGGLLTPAGAIGVGWHNVYLIAKPDGTTDYIAEPNNEERNPQFWFEPELAAAGFTDSTLHRRVGYAFWDGATMPEWADTAGGRHYWATPFADVDNVATLANSGPRDTILLPHVPSAAVGIVSMHALLSAAGEILITTLGQDDTEPAEDNFTMRGNGAADSLTWNGDLKMINNASHPGSFRARRDPTGGTTISQWSVMVHGWIDLRDGVAGPSDDVDFP